MEYKKNQEQNDTVILLQGEDNEKAQYTAKLRGMAINSFNNKNTVWPSDYSMSFFNLTLFFY